MAICPFTADIFALFLSHLDKQCFTYFLKQLQLHLLTKGLTKVLLIGDGATAHTSQNWLEHRWLEWQKLPTACPELNPVERFFEELRAKTSNKVFANKQQLESYLESLILNYYAHPYWIPKLTLFPYLNAKIR